jgi:hypothetical protein
MFIPHREGLYGSHAQYQLRTTSKIKATKLKAEYNEATKLPEQIITLTKTHLKSLDTERLIHQILYHTVIIVKIECANKNTLRPNT